ncbi:MAG TPA: DUF4910 domain-containing protein [Rhodothermales bacterium]
MKSFCSAIVVITVFLGGLRLAGAQPLLDARRLDLLHEELSGELAKEHVIAITRHHRIQGSRGYRDAAHYVLNELRSAGFSEEHAYIESFESDGRKHYQTWQSPSGWDIESAELRIVEPVDRRIVGYPEIAMSLITYSNAGHVRAELVDVGSGTSDDDYAGKNVKGKFVLASGYGGSVHRLAVLRYGAAAVVCFLDDDRSEEYPDMLAYTGMWPRADELDRVTFGFNLTNRQGEDLRRRLARGERVVLEGTVEGIGLEPYFMDVVVAEIPGTTRSDEEIVFSAHLDHPKESANDNASGSAVLIDIARSIAKLIAEGRIERPARTIRFLWVPEWYGTMAYIDAHPEMVGPELGGKVLANLNLDMVGEHLELLHSRMRFTKTPHSLPSALNDVVENMAETVASLNVRTPRGSLSAFNYVLEPYGGGSDHMMFIDRKIPGMMFSHSPDYTHHTSEDTPDKVDPVELERSAIIGAGAALYLADLDSEEAIALVRVVGAGALVDVAQAYGGRVNAREFSYLAEYEMEVIRSVLHFNDAMEVAEEVQRFELLVESVAKPLSDRLVPGTSTDTDGRVPVRLTRGPLAFDLPESALPAERIIWYNQSKEGKSLINSVRFEAVNFVDGARSVGEIAERVVTEFPGVSPEAVERLVEDLVEVGVLAWK